jgi:hypothetical protein
MTEMLENKKCLLCFWSGLRNRSTSTPQLNLVTRGGRGEASRRSSCVYRHVHLFQQRQFRSAASRASRPASNAHTRAPKVYSLAVRPSIAVRRETHSAGNLACMA